MLGELKPKGPKGPYRRASVASVFHPPDTLSRLHNRAQRPGRGKLNSNWEHQRLLHTLNTSDHAPPAVRITVVPGQILVAHTRSNTIARLTSLSPDPSHNPGNRRICGVVCPTHSYAPKQESHLTTTVTNPPEKYHKNQQTSHYSFSNHLFPLRLPKNKTTKTRYAPPHKYVPADPNLRGNPGHLRSQ